MTATGKTTRPSLTRRHAGTSAQGFTLFEMLIVVGIIIMVLSVALPSINSMLASSADSQAYNMLSGQLTVARAEAITYDTPVAVHVQIGQESASLSGEDLSKACFSAITWIPPDSNNPTFSLMPGYSVNRMPESLAFGEISDDFIDGANFTLGLGLEDFTSFSILFDPQGEVVKRVKWVNGLVAPAFHSDLAGPNSLWDATYANGEDGVQWVTLFEYTKLLALNRVQQQIYLDENAQFLPVNTYTGRLFPRDVRGN